MASEPVVRELAVRVRAALLHISVTKVPNEDNVLEVLDHTDEAIVVDATTTAPTEKVLSNLTKVPAPESPQLIVVGQIPSGPADGIV